MLAPKAVYNSSHIHVGRIRMLNSKQFSCSAKVRYRQDDQNCLVSINRNGRCDVAFFESQRAVTPGQSIVFYVDDRCLGGGIIERAWRENISRI